MFLMSHESDGFTPDDCRRPFLPFTKLLRTIPTVWPHAAVQPIGPALAFRLWEIRTTAPGDADRFGPNQSREE